jgi:2-iminobutanoate/2-iminopropanoate deaminase
MKEIITTSQAPAPIGPYNQAVRTGNLLFISGQICIDPATGELVGGSIGDETHQVMKNLMAILLQAGMDLSKVVKTTIFLTDMKKFSEVNEVYGQYFKGNYPARETVEVSALPKFVNVEISMIASSD